MMTGSSERLAFGFARDGFAILKGKLSAETVENYEREIIALAREGFQSIVGKAEDGSAADEGDRFGELVAIFNDAGPRAKELSSWLYRRLASCGSSQRVLALIEPTRLASTLLGGDVNTYRVRPESTMTRIDLPGASLVRLDWHQEVRYDETRAAGIQFWIPLFQRSSWESGSMEIASGSHVEGVLEVDLQNADLPGARQYTVPQVIVSKYAQTIVEINPGDVAVLDCRTIHRSSDPARQKGIKVTLIGRCTR